MCFLCLYDASKLALPIHLGLSALLHRENGIGNASCVRPTSFSCVCFRAISQQKLQNALVTQQNNALAELCSFVFALSASLFMEGEVNEQAMSILWDQRVIFCICYFYNKLCLYTHLIKNFTKCSLFFPHIASVEVRPSPFLVPAHIISSRLRNRRFKIGHHFSEEIFLPCLWEGYQAGLLVHSVCKTNRFTTSTDTKCLSFLLSSTPVVSAARQSHLCAPAQAIICIRFLYVHSSYCMKIPIICNSIPFNY